MAPLVLLFLCLVVVVKAAHPDTHSDCGVWAQRGECEVSVRGKFAHEFIGGVSDVRATALLEAAMR